MVNTLVTTGAIAVLCVVLAGCTKKEAEAETASAAAATMAPRRTLTPEDLDPSRASPTTMASKVYRQLGVEKTNRPAVALPAERVLAAFHKDGIEAEALKQGLGEPIKAGYCALSHTKKGVGFTLCEYPSAELAREGKALSEARYSGGLGRKLYLNGQTLLVVRAAAEEEAKAEAEAMAAIFEELK